MLPRTRSIACAAAACTVVAILVATSLKTWPVGVRDEGDIQLEARESGRGRDRGRGEPFNVQRVFERAFSQSPTPGTINPAIPMHSTDVNRLVDNC